MSLCETNACHNNGTCVIQDSKMICICDDHFSGEMCEISKKNCKNGNICSNGGICLETSVRSSIETMVWILSIIHIFLQTGVTCQCPESSFGDDCSKSMNDKVPTTLTHPVICDHAENVCFEDGICKQVAQIY